MRVERSHRLCVFPRYFSTQGRMGIGGTHWDMASTKQLSALGWQSLWAWWLPLHRKGLISPDRAYGGGQTELGSNYSHLSSSELIWHIDGGVLLHVCEAIWCFYSCKIELLNRKGVAKYSQMTGKGQMTNRLQPFNGLCTKNSKYRVSCHGAILSFLILHSGISSLRLFKLFKFLENNEGEPSFAIAGRFRHIRSSSYI